MLKRYSDFHLGDLLLTYWLDDADRVSMTLIPLSMEGKTLEKAYDPEPLAQIHFEGDPLPNGYGNRMTLACTRASDALRFCSQNREKEEIVTRLSGPEGRAVCHRVRWQAGWQGSR